MDVCLSWFLHVLYGWIPCFFKGFRGYVFLCVILIHFLVTDFYTSEHSQWFPFILMQKKYCPDSQSRSRLIMAMPFLKQRPNKAKKSEGFSPNTFCSMSAAHIRWWPISTINIRQNDWLERLFAHSHSNNRNSAIGCGASAASSCIIDSLSAWEAAGAAERGV